jgi:hypothetical protein
MVNSIFFAGSRFYVMGTGMHYAGDWAATTGAETLNGSDAKSRPTIRTSAVTTTTWGAYDRSYGFFCSPDIQFN